MKKTHKNLICLLLAFCMALVLVPCAAADSEWTREGYFADENAYMISVTWMELDDESGWYVACMLGEDLIEDSYGGMLPQEGDALHGALLSDAGKEALTVTVSEAEEGGLRLEIEGGETYLFSPIELETADYGINIYTDGMGYIDYAETEDELSFDEPLTYAGFGFSEPCTCVLGAKAEIGRAHV